MVRKLVVAAAVLALAGGALAREMTSVYVVTAVANKQGWLGTDWHTDLTLYNPHNKVLYVKLAFLPTGQDNSAGVPTAPPIDLQPWETLNLWDVLGPSRFQRARPDRCVARLRRSRPQLVSEHRRGHEL